MMKALSVRQPWAWAIFYAGKRIENRSWPTRYRGPILIHAALAMSPLERAAARDLMQGENPCTNGFLRFDFPFGHVFPTIRHDQDFERGGIVGRAEIVDCVTWSDSPWFTGPYGFVLDKVEPLPFQPCRGALGLFTPDVLLEIANRPVCEEVA